MGYGVDESHVHTAAAGRHRQAVASRRPPVHQRDSEPFRNVPEVRVFRAGSAGDHLLRRRRHIGDDRRILRTPLRVVGPDHHHHDDPGDEDAQLPKSRHRWHTPPREPVVPGRPRGSFRPAAAVTSATPARIMTTSMAVGGSPAPQRFPCDRPIPRCGPRLRRSRSSLRTANWTHPPRRAVHATPFDLSQQTQGYMPRPGRDSSRRTGTGRLGTRTCRTPTPVPQVTTVTARRRLSPCPQKEIPGRRDG